MLYGLAEQGNAPEILKTVNARGIPVVAVLVSSSVTALGLLIIYFIPEKAFSLLMMLVVSALVINWLMISMTHLKFIKAMKAEGTLTTFKSIFSPWTNYLSIAFMFFILLVMSFTAEMRIAVFLIPVWLLLLFITYFVQYRNKAQPAASLQSHS